MTTPSISALHQGRCKGMIIVVVGRTTCSFLKRYCQVLKLNSLKELILLNATECWTKHEIPVNVIYSFNSPNTESECRNECTNILSRAAQFLKFCKTWWKSRFDAIWLLNAVSHINEIKDVINLYLECITHFSNVAT